jgi:ABC-type antimicrobial peptide transport system permease subunit
MTGALTGDAVAFVGEEPGDVRGMWETTSPAYFQTLGIRLLRGRLTTWADNEKAPHVAVVSEQLANSLVPGGDVLGRHIRFGASPQNQNVEIVGVVSNATLGNPRLTEAPVVYRPILQMGRTANYPSVFIRTDERSAAAVTSALREIVRESGYEFVAEVERLDDVLARAPSSERMGATLAVTVAGLAAMLSFTGVFALLAYSVTRRTREIGLRSAVGAEPASVIWMVMREGLVLTVIGVIVGLPTAYFAARVLGTLTYGISPADPLTFAMAALLFVSLGVAAGIVPARRAARVDPVIALRAE